MKTINGFDVPALQETIATIGSCPELGRAQFNSTSEWKDDRRVHSTIGDFNAAGSAHQRSTPHTVATDLPEAILGTDTGPSPLELAITALTSCITTTLVSHAAARGIQLDSLRVGAAGDMDLQGFLNLSGKVRRGYQELRLTVMIRASLPDLELTSFAEEAVQFSPVLDLFRNGTQVVIEREWATNHI